ncbi:MAG TPA: DUF423 domain-containing protein [Lacipirellulaceae bacterium]|nr:DUF423 domain-containing protein [Lacipirellulaceae bacterium]
MPSISRRWIAIGALLGALGVALGAYGAHGLSDLLEKRLGHSGDDLHYRIAISETAVRYQMYHAVAICFIGLALDRRDSAWWRFAAWAFLVGVIIFCGLLKVLAFADPKWNWLGAIVPLGGLSMIAGWLAVAIGALRK